MKARRLLPAALAACLCANAAADSPPNVWEKVADGPPAWRTGSVLVRVPDTGKMLLFGGTMDLSKVPNKERAEKNVHYVQAFDPAAAEWTVFSEARPKKGVHPYYQATGDPKSGKIYCLSQILRYTFYTRGGRLHSFDLGQKTWTSYDQDPVLRDMHWNTMALDPVKRRLVVVGADKRRGHVGWSRTVLYDLRAGKWSMLPPPPREVVTQHSERVAAKEALISLIGRTRLAWYRDPEGIGTEAEREVLAKRSAALAKIPGMAEFKGGLRKYDELLAVKKTLAALKVARALQQKVEARAEEQYPVPPCRRNSPLVYDAKNQCMVLFGGDHEDYLMNDTWVLDLETDTWRRLRPKVAPGPRAGHALVYLPASGRVAMYGGYTHNNSTAYSYAPRWSPLRPVQLWLLDVKAERWDLVMSWTPKKGDASKPPYHGAFYGFYSDRYSPPPLASDESDRLFLALQDATWRMAVHPAKCDAEATGTLGTPPNQRLYRAPFFRAAYCETADPPPKMNLDDLPANRFVKLPKPPRNTCGGCRSRVWGTAAWDPDRDQILVWGGGHCVRSENPPIHYSPVSGRMVEGYDAQESYTQCGTIGSTMMNRAWVGGHSYNTYGYVPRDRMLVTSNGYVYDPSRMDWLRHRPFKPPFHEFSRGPLEHSRHGAVVMAAMKRGYPARLWLFNLETGWTELTKPKQKLPRFAGFVYDSKRDRMLFAYPGGWNKPGNGSLLAFHFKNRWLETLTPANAELGRASFFRELAYVEHADWVLFGTPYPWPADKKTKRHYVRAYDCAANRWMLLDIPGYTKFGKPSIGRITSEGWLYDAKRKLVYVVEVNRWIVWALRLDPETVTVLQKKP
jgi:hypothetical protein